MSRDACLRWCRVLDVCRHRVVPPHVYVFVFLSFSDFMFRYVWYDNYSSVMEFYCVSCFSVLLDYRWRIASFLQRSDEFGAYLSQPLVHVSHVRSVAIGTRSVRYFVNTQFSLWTCRFGDLTMLLNFCCSLNTILILHWLKFCRDNCKWHKRTKYTTKSNVLSVNINFHNYIGSTKQMASDTFVRSVRWNKRINTKKSLFGV